MAGRNGTTSTLGPRAVFDALPTASVLLRPDLTVADANAAFLRLVGRRRAEVVHRPGAEIFPPAPGHDADPVRELCERVLSSGRAERLPRVRYAAAPAGGQPAENWCSLVVCPVTGDGGRVDLLLGCAQVVAGPGHDDSRADPDGQEAARRMSRFTDMALRLAAVQNLEDLVRIVTGHGLALLGADGGGIAVPSQTGQWRLIGSSGFSDRHRTAWEVVSYDSPLPVCHTARTGERMLLPDAGATDAFAPVMRTLRAENGRRAWATVPLRVDGQLLGALAAGWAQDHAFTTAELELLDGCAAQCAQALERITSARAAQEEALSVRRMAETLQRSLLSRPPVREGVELAMRYQPAARGAEVGGDWFDAFATRSGGTVLAVGDVTGHDQAAAAAMGQVRNIVRGIAYDGDDRPVNLLARLDQAMAGLGIDTLATAVLAVLDAPVAGATGRRVRWANAGHLPPLLRRADGRVEVLDGDDDLLLGLDASTVRREHVLELEPEDLLVLYTDGLVERRGADLDEGIAVVRRTLEDPDGSSAAAWADTLLGTLRASGVEDDTALLVLHVDPVPTSTPAAPTADDSADLVLPADPRSVRDARRLTRRCCHRHGFDEDTTDTAVLLTSELVTNAVVHGRSDARLHIATTPRDIRVEVGDDNDRQPVLQDDDDDALSGRGLGLLQTAATRWGIEPADIGKVVWFSLDAAR